MKKENIANTLVIEDTMRAILSKENNVKYRPWDNKFTSKYNDSALGNFSKEYISGVKYPVRQPMPIQQETQAASTLNKHQNKGLGIGGKCFSTNGAKDQFTQPKPVAGAFK